MCGSAGDDPSMHDEPRPYNRADYKDRLFPEGYPPCIQCGQKPVYLGGLCGDCFAAKGEAQRETARQAEAARENGAV